MEQRGSVQTRARQVRILQPFADKLKRSLEGRGAVTGARVADLLRGNASFRVAVAEARLNKKYLIKAFVSLLPDLFKREMRGNTFYVTYVGPS